MNITRAFLLWLPIGATITCMCFAMYMLEQQHYRQELDDPQVAMVTDVQSALLAGKQPADVVPQGESINADVSLDPFVVVFDTDGTSLASNATVSGKSLQVPVGIFNDARTDGQHRVTWQPSAGTRIALVVRPVPGKDWYVAAGRNMKDGEDHIARLGILTLLAWIGSMLGTLFVVYVSYYLLDVLKK